MFLDDLLNIINTEYKAAWLDQRGNGRKTNSCLGNKTALSFKRKESTVNFETLM